MATKLMTRKSQKHLSTTCTLLLSAVASPANSHEGVLLSVCFCNTNAQIHCFSHVFPTKGLLINCLGNIPAGTGPGFDGLSSSVIKQAWYSLAKPSTSTSV